MSRTSPPAAILAAGRRRPTPEATSPPTITITITIDRSPD